MTAKNGFTRGYVFAQEFIREDVTSDMESRKDYLRSIIDMAKSFCCYSAFDDGIVSYMVSHMLWE